MREGIRVSVTTDDEDETVTVHDTEGTVRAGDATFRFAVDDIGTSTGDDTGAGDDGPNEDARGPGDPSDDPRYVAPLDDLPEDGTKLYEARAGRRGTEFIVRREGDSALAWRNSCPHEPDVRLDEGFGARVTDDHIVCHKHGARFVRGEGFCTRGPCRGQSLDAILVEVRDGQVFLSDDRFDSCRKIGF
ncbi:Rieske (2Fe-2S) protein [Halomarina litorea]|uniref:Rieske (2Fe-2S) protein n=1 Tax=Halomarina litorea TaxID=2961595 RepID=UPI0020C2D88A|nr:Rieske 2Fe-2S domain-containing protein [Halomarina sp. BCD28]